MVKKIILIVAAALVLIGAGLFLTVLAANNWDFSRIGAGEHIVTTYPVEEDFRFIAMETHISDIRFVPSDDGTCKVITEASKGDDFTVAVKSGALYILEEHDAKWFDHHFIINRPTITVCLPKEEYEILSITGQTGDVEIPDDFSFACVIAVVSTGDITCTASTSGSMILEATTGDITVSDVSAEDLQLTVSTGRVTAKNVKCSRRVAIYVTTGRTVLEDVNCKTLISTGSTGKIEMRNVIAQEKIHVERSTGDVVFDRCDAAEISVETTTGDVSGTLLTEKIFFTDTNTGDVRIPKTTTGGKCEITTTTGDIGIELAK